MKLFKLSEECPQVKASLTGVKELVTYLKQSHLNGQLSTTLKQNVPTRWNSELIMLEAYKKSANEVKALMIKMEMVHKLIDINDTLIQELIDFLVPFRECSEILSGDKYQTIQLVALWYYDLEEHIKIKYNDSEELKKLKQQSVHRFKEFVINSISSHVCWTQGKSYKKKFFELYFS